MGLWCTDIAINIYIKEIGEYHESYKNFDQNIAKLMELVINFMKVIKNVFAPELADPNCPLTTASPKMRRLLELLMKYKPIDGQKSDLCVIVFVNQRSVARVLSQWFVKLKELNR
jgi:hypothetical protein